MSTEAKNIRFRFEVDSELKQVSSELDVIIQKTQQLTQTTAGSGAQTKALLQQQLQQVQQLQGAVQQATQQQAVAVQQSLAQVTTAQQAELQKQVNAHKAALDIQVINAQAAAKEKEALAAKQVAAFKAAEQQQTDAARAEEARRLDAVRTANSMKLADYKAQTDATIQEKRKQTAAEIEEEKRKTAEATAQGRIRVEQARSLANQETEAARQASMAYRQAIELDTDFHRAQNRARVSQFEEARKQETIAFRGEIQRQNMELKAALQEQLIELRNQGQFWRDIRSLIAAAFGVYEVYEFTKAVIDAKSKVDSFRMGLTQMLGSKQEADQLTRELLDMAKRTPFEVEQLMQVTFMLKGMGVATRELLPTLEQLGNMAAVVGQDRLPLIAKAYTDVMNKGKLMKQEINQFAENGVPLYDLLAESMGKTRQEVVKMAEDHTISFEMVKKAIRDASDVGGRYYNMMAIQAQTLGGQMSNLKDAFFVAKAVVGDYFENGLGKGVKTIREFTELTIGSEAAVKRTVNVITAGVSAWAAYRIAMELVAAQKLINEGRTKQLTTAQTLLTLNTEAMSLAMNGATGSLRAMWAALAANPLGAILTAVSLGISLWQSYAAVTTEVTSAVGAQEVELQREKNSLIALVELAMSKKEGDQQRIQLISQLMAKYPEFFAGMDAEKVKNAELIKMLEKVNDVFRDRIRLAREAYAEEKLGEREKALMERERQFFEKIKDVLPADFMAKYGPDSQKLIELINQTPGMVAKINSSAFTWFGSGTMIEQLTAIRQGFDTIEKERKEHKQRMLNIEESETNARIEAEVTRHNQVIAQIRQGNAKTEAERKAQAILIEQENKLHHNNLLAITKQTEEEKTTIIKKEGKKRQEANFLNAQQIEVILKEANQNTLKETKSYLDAREAEEIKFFNARKNKMVKDAEEARKVTAEIHQFYDVLRAEAAAKDQREFQGKIKADIDSLTEFFGQRSKELVIGIEAMLGKERERYVYSIAEAKKYQKEVARIQQEINEVTEQNEKAAIAARKKSLQEVFSFIGEQGGVLGELAKQARYVVTNLELLSGTSAKAAQDNYDRAKAALLWAQTVYNEADQQGKVRIKQAELDLEKAAGKRDEAVRAAKEAEKGMVMMALELGRMLAKGIADGIADGWQSMAESLRKTRDVVVDFYEEIMALSKSAMQAELTNSQNEYEAKLRYARSTVTDAKALAAEEQRIMADSYTERERIIRQYYEQQNKLATDRSSYDAQLSYISDVAAAHANYTSNIGSAIQSLLKLDVVGWIEGMATAHKKKAADMEIATLNRTKRELEAEKWRVEQGIELERELLENKLEALDQALKAYRDAKQAEMDEARRAADAEKKEVERARDAAVDAAEKKLAAFKESAQREYEAVRKSYDDQISALRDRQKAEEQALKEMYDYRRSLLEQSKKDEIEAAGILDRVRNEALERYRAAEVARLEATRERILATLTDEAEKRQVEEAYARQIEQVHKDVEDAKLDKTKGNSLAATQIRAEEKEQAERLKKEEAATLKALADNYQQLFRQQAEERDAVLAEMKERASKREAELKDEIVAIRDEAKSKIQAIETRLEAELERLRNEITRKEAEATEERKRLQREYTAAFNAAQQQMFEITKQIKIAELRAEIAQLKSKRWLLNAGKINAAISEIEGIIRMIEGSSLGNPPASGGADVGSGPIQPDPLYQEVITQPRTPTDSTGRPIAPVDMRNGQPISQAYSAQGHPVVITYNASGKRIVVYDQFGNSFEVAYADGYNTVTGERFFKGTEYVERGSYPNGVDTIPAWLNEGERVITTEDNKKLGGMSNEELVRRALAFDDLRLSWQDIGGLSLPDVASLPPAPQEVLIDLSELKQELQQLREDFMRKSLVSINIDEKGFLLQERSAHATIEHYTSLFSR
ncbi:hypothetical protein GCM10023189_43200 [Nibrella saemangeumensis]|uniref:Tape measure protein N-terminal domain-containing protein n=1 Tax=Nibrella saemangeumensis TaxID=1084526 RepID=A0ABP8NAS2_9BACT